jgi:hypothetical protein
VRGGGGFWRRVSAAEDTRGEKGFVRGCILKTAIYLDG